MFYVTSAIVVGQGIHDTSTAKLARLGQRVDAFDPYFGAGEFVYGRAGAALNMGQVCVMDSAFVATAVGNTANLGRQLYIAAAPMAQDAYGWFNMSGTYPWNSTASVAAGTTVGITAAGQVGANTAGKQILGAVSVRPATTTVVKANSVTMTGWNVVQLPDTDGLFVGQTASGTGIPGATTVSSIDYAKSQVTLSNNATANGTVSVTFTNTGFNTVGSNRPIAQGAIT